MPRVPSLHRGLAREVRGISKLGANDRTHAVTIAIKRGFIDG